MVAGVQSPAQTIERGSGMCRDFTFLFMEGARSMGFAARFVTGYLHDPAAERACPRSSRAKRTALTI